MNIIRWIVHEIRVLYNLIFVSDVGAVINAMEYHTGYTLDEIQSDSKDRKMSLARRKLIINLDMYSRAQPTEIAGIVNRSTQYIYSVLNKSEV